MINVAGGRVGPLWNCDLRPALDWVQIELTLPTPSQHRHVRARMPAHWSNTYIHPVEGERSSRQFILRVHNPSGPDKLMTDLQMLVQPGQRELRPDDVRVVGVEVALDAYALHDDPELLVDAAFHMVWNLARPPAGQALVTEPQHYHAAAGHRTVRQALREGWSINVGRTELKRESTMGLNAHVDAVRCYLKNYDSNEQGRYQALDQSQWRARIERTLIGTTCPFTTIAAWRAYRFESLAPMFAMCRTDPSASEFMKLLQSAGGPLGRADDDEKRAAHRRLRRTGTLRDIPLNDRIRTSFRKLTRAQARGNSDATGESKSRVRRGERPTLSGES